PLYKRDSTVSQTQVLLMLQALFPAPGRGLSPLEPDLIGEHHVAQVAGSELMEAGLAWAAGNRDRRQNILTTLNRATRSEHGEAAAKPAAALEGLIQTRGGELGADLISVAVATPGQLLQLCPRLEEQVSGFELGTLAAIDRALPRYSLVLSDLCLSLAERLTELARRPGSSSLEDDDEGNVEALAVLADRLNDFGVRLLDVGRIEDALNASAEALGIHRDLSASLPDTFLPKLAANLNNIGVLFSASGRRMDALEASKEAVELRRILSTPRPDVFLRNLTTSLTNLGIALSDLGRHEEALKASEEAVGFWRSLAAARPDRFLRDLATELNNLGNRLSSLGHHEDALKASEEAVEIRRNLAASHPDAFLPNLAASLTNLGNGLHALDRREDALKASEEALGNYRTLVALRPDAFTPLLAKSLGANSQIHASDGRFVEAAGAAAEGMAVLKPLLQQSPAAFADLMRNLREAYLRYCREGELVPDQELLDGLDEVSGPAQDEST
ncbi:MAG: tetratricopeptide repeat protein, partial [Pseudomonadota bacterium]